MRSAEYKAEIHYLHSAIRNPQSAIGKTHQWESNPHVRHGKAIGYRYIMRHVHTLGHNHHQQVGEESNPAG